MPVGVETVSVVTDVDALEVEAMVVEEKGNVEEDCLLATEGSGLD